MLLFPNDHYRVHNSPLLLPIMSHVSPVYASLIQDPDNVILPSMLRLPSGLLPSAFHIRTLYVLLLSPTSATCSAHLILLVIFGKVYKWWSSSSCSFLQSPLSTLFSHTPSTCTSLNVGGEISCGCSTSDSYLCKCLDLLSVRSDLLDRVWIKTSRLVQMIVVQEDAVALPAATVTALWRH